jgi:hypothetical protein
MRERKPKLLFICKKRNASYGVSFGLINSCEFICNALGKHGIEGKVITVIDNNCIDREVHHYRPTHIFIEALWVVPEKMRLLARLHPHIKWFIRVHSKLPFLANEGVAFHWLREYADIGWNVFLSANSMEIVKAFKKAYGIDVFYLPNIYCPPEHHHEKEHQSHNHIDIGCLGSIRPMKNQLIQAVSAIIFGNECGKKIRFHINGGRVEQKGDEVLKNMKYAFKGTPHELVIHEWMCYEEFIRLVREMDLGMQVSFSETFNIVGADFVANDIPLVGSSEISWLSKSYMADPNDIDDIVMKLHRAYQWKRFGMQFLNKVSLHEYNRDATEAWLEFLEE